MRFHYHRSLFSASLVVLLLLGFHAFAFAQINPKIETTVGTGSNISYFVLDFSGGSAPQSYAFAYRYDGTKTGGDLIAALATGAPGFTVQLQQFDFGNFYQGFGYAGKFLTTPADFSSFWSYWTAADGQNWSSPQTFGADSRTLTNGSWDGWSYAFNNVAVAPRTPLAAVPTAAPEPGSIALLASGAALGIGMVLRRRKPEGRSKG